MPSKGGKSQCAVNKVGSPRNLASLDPQVNPFCLVSKLCQQRWLSMIKLLKYLQLNPLRAHKPHHAQALALLDRDALLQISDGLADLCI